MSKSKNNQLGFTILETLIAFAILTAGIITIAAVFPLGININKSAERKTVAMHLAQAKVEELFSIGYDNITTGTIENRQRLSDDSANPFYHYERETNVSYVDEDLATTTTDTGMKQATVNMYWPDPLHGTTTGDSLIIIISRR